MIDSSPNSVRNLNCCHKQMYPLQNYTHTTQQRKLIVKVSTEQDWSRLKKLTAECEYKIYNYKYIPKKESNIIIVGTPPHLPFIKRGGFRFFP